MRKPQCERDAPLGGRSVFFSLFTRNVFYVCKKKTASRPACVGARQEQRRGAARHPRVPHRPELLEPRAQHRVRRGHTPSLLILQGISLPPFSHYNEFSSVPSYITREFPSYLSNTTRNCSPSLLPARKHARTGARRGGPLDTYSHGLHRRCRAVAWARVRIRHGAPKRGRCPLSTRILGTRTAPFSPFLIPNRSPHGVTPRS